MTCQDCIHYNDKPHNLCKKWIMPLDRDNDPCELFEPQHTCSECIHFYEREPKPWRTDKDLGYCDYSREGKIEVNRNCPANRWCDNKYEPKEDSWESVSK